jgi:hypothetical protein
MINAHGPALGPRPSLRRFGSREHGALGADGSSALLFRNRLNGNADALRERAAFELAEKLVKHQPIEILGSQPIGRIFSSIQ